MRVAVIVLDSERVIATNRTDHFAELTHLSGPFCVRSSNGKTGIVRARPGAFRVPSSGSRAIPTRYWESSSGRSGSGLTVYFSMNRYLTLRASAEPGTES